MDWYGGRRYLEKSFCLHSKNCASDNTKRKIKTTKSEKRKESRINLNQKKRPRKNKDATKTKRTIPKET